jgi:hypothetical protein
MRAVLMQRKEVGDEDGRGKGVLMPKEGVWTERKRG